MKHLLHYHAQLIAALRGGRDFRSLAPDAVRGEIAGLCPVESAQLSPRAGPGKLNIAVICREYPPETAYGGMATYCYCLTHGLIEQGHRVTVISQGKPGLQRDFHGRVDVIRIQPRPRALKRSFESMRRHGRLGYAKNMLFYSLGLHEQILDLEKAGGPFDVVDLPDHGAEGIIPILFWPGAKTVRLHSPWSLLNCMRANFFAEDDIEEIYALERAALHYANRITSPSQDLAARVRTFFGLAQQIPFVPNPVDTDLFCPAEPLDGRTRVCFAGRFEVRKGLTTLFEAIPTVLRGNPEVEFHLVGRDVSGFRSIYRSQLDPARVHFHEAQPLLELPGFYQRADLAVVPSHYDNSPYTCVEPMSCGIPVIGTCTGGMPEFIEHGKTGLIIPSRDPGALASAILELAGNPGARRSMGSAARERMKELLDYRQVAVRMVEQYQAASGHARGAEASPDILDRQPGRPALPHGLPDSLRGEIIILAERNEKHLVQKTLASARAQGRAVQSVTVLWRGGPAPALEGCRGFSVSDNLAEAAARVIATVLTDFFVCLRAGDVLDRTAMTKLAWQFAAYENVGVVSLPGTNRPQQGPGRAIQPVLRAEAVRGRALLAPARDCTWKDVIQGLYQRVCEDGWGEVVLDEPLVNCARRCDLDCCRGRPLVEISAVGAKPQMGVAESWPTLVSSIPAPGRMPAWLRRLTFRGLRAASGPGLQPIRYQVRRVLGRLAMTRPLIAWLRKEKGALSTGGFSVSEDSRPGVVIVARSLADSMARWREVQAEEAMAGSEPIVVLTDCPGEPQASGGFDEEIAIYHVDRLVPPEYRVHAIAHLLRLHVRSVLCSAKQGRGMDGG